MVQVWATLLACLAAIVATAGATSNNLTDLVTWDPYSLMVKGERVFIFAGEFHYERLPNPVLWRDVLEKYKANGLNAISVYFFWSYHSARRDVFDFETPGKDIQVLLDTARDVGLYVIARPGPYCNAETNGGGLALWGSDGSLGKVRTSDAVYERAWKPWMDAVNAILAKNQISYGGNVILYQIENELQETTHSPSNTLVLYMEALENATREAGIVVPTTSNEKGMRSESWSTDYEDVGGAVNVYGLDSYPGGFSCTNINSGFNVVRTYYQWFQNYSYTQPELLPEFEAGYILGWGSYFFDQCLAEHDPAFADVYYKNNIGQRVTMQSLYMAFGGTNWGNLGAPVVYTSYDYSAPLRETREVQLKFKQTKLIALFTRVSQDLLITEMESNGTGNAVSTDDVYSWVLRNPETGAGFYTLQQSSTPSREIVTFSTFLKTSLGTVTVPMVNLNGRQSKILTTDYHFGQHTLLYSSADILTYGILKGQAALVMYADAGQTSEFAFKDNTDLSYKIYGTANISSSAVSFSNTTSYSSHIAKKYVYTQTYGSTVLQLSNGVLVYLLETQTAWTFFAPPTTMDPNVSPENQVFVLGPYNVRNVSCSDNAVILVGDNANTTNIEVYTGGHERTIVWNGKRLDTRRTAYGSLVGTAPGATDRVISLPQLSFLVADSLPEAQPDYDDSQWVVCNKSSSLSPTVPLTLPVLFSSDHGYYAGIKVYRGRFNGKASSVNITAQGGAAAGWTAWLNGHYVGGNTGNATQWRSSAILDLTQTSIPNATNVLTVVTDYTGHDETSTGPAGVENARGLLGAALYNGSRTTNFTSWKIQGNAGGNANIDPVRGPMNEDGLYGTRLGWHLPGFEPSVSEWKSGSPYEGLNKSGINWYHTTFQLGIDADLDVPLGIELDAPARTEASVQIYVNGYQYGKFIPQIGPQTRFPFPPGVLNNRGENTISLALWAMTDKGARLSNATLFAYNVYQSGFAFDRDWSALQPRYTMDRSRYR
ncbi:hypothetical protein LTR62_003166 [Meristemomyces frigidus]|uniref:beta-galactosidase n=1 Tax=Meristemomyces frigidus TaxID=1508187 RepID=A0AAN7TKA3_9PEZI|nr:hypothetical protein LTR62_003166 [Meristemomyces frigidus]